jgi:hypothetical protein
MEKINNGFAALTDPELQSDTEVVLTSLTENEDYPDPDPTLAAVQADLDNFVAACVGAKTGNRLAITARKERKVQLIKQLHLLSNYVAFKAKGDTLKLQGSGFKLSKPKGSAPDIIVPEIPVLENALASGGVKTRFKAVPGAKSYILKCTQDATLAEGSWKMITTTTTKNTLTGLESAKAVYVKVAAVGIKGQILWSGVASKIVQ